MQSDSATTSATDRDARVDLLGLAGAAVLLVVVCHVWFGRVSAGLDVLLVLAGFVVGTRVLRAIGTADAALIGTEIAWVGRRLLPALVLVLGVSAILTVLIQPQTRWEDFADQTLASLGFYQNWQLMRTASDYVQASETVTPLQHLWLVSVLGQVFAGFLALVGLAVAATARGGRRYRRNLLVVMTGVATVASFSYAVTVQSDNHIVAYYSSFARAWEPLIGVLAAAWVARIGWPGWLRTVGSVVGWAAIVACGLLVDGWALVPVGATVLIILCAPRFRSWAWGGEWLSVFVAIGAIAYALYLWHWPLLIFWLAYVNEDSVGVVAGCGVVAASVVAAFVTGRIVDARWGRLRRLLAGSAIVIVSAALAVVSLGWRGHVAMARDDGSELSILAARDYPGARALLDNRRVAKIPMRPTVLEAADDVPPATIDGCVTDFPGVEVKTCGYGDPVADKTIALVGGSHSEHWLPALHVLGREHGFKVTTYLKMGCPLTTKAVPVIAGALDPYPQCRTWSDNALARIIADRPDYVFFTSTRPILNGPGDYVPDYYLGIWDALSAKGIGMLGIRDTPWMVKSGWFFSPVDCLADGGDADACGLERGEALAPRNPTLTHLADYPLMHALDLSDAVCRPDICRAVEGNVMVYHDAHHLSATYVRTLTDELGRQLRDATAWW